MNVTGAVATGLCGSASSTSSFAFLRAIRLARVMRVLKLGNFSAGVKVFTVAIMKSTPATAILLRPSAPCTPHFTFRSPLRMTAVPSAVTVASEASAESVGRRYDVRIRRAKRGAKREVHVTLLDVTLLLGPGYSKRFVASLLAPHPPLPLLASPPSFAPRLLSPPLPILW